MYICVFKNIMSREFFIRNSIWQHINLGKTHEAGESA